MSAAVTLDISQIAAVRGMLGHLAGADTRELMERLGIVAWNSVEDSFEREESPDGVAWLPSLRAKKEGGKTLQDKGILAASVEASSRTSRLVTPTSVEIGSNLVYAPIHQFGGKVKRERSFAMIADIGFTEIDMPARPFLGWNADAMDEAEKQAQDWLAELLPPGALS